MQDFLNDRTNLRRSQRQIARQSFHSPIDNILSAHDHEEDGDYRLIKCNKFKGEQPTMVFISFQSLLLMNIHAHLFSNEIIGFGGGQFFTHKSGRQALYIHDVYKVDPLENTGADRSKSVEMAPESSESARKLAEIRGQTICGWYHSHPIFETNPSKVDIFNQNNYQKMYDNHTGQPFVGFIIGPYSPNLNASKVVSELTCFYVVEEDEAFKPYELKVNIVPQKKINARVKDQIKDFLNSHLVAPDMVNLGDKWKGKMTRHEKFKKCLKELISKNNEKYDSFSPDEIVDKESQISVMEKS